ncbi:MAG: 50S ribosomal protein L11 methyltransferase [Gammaproteobacteria bacterium]|nr:MAG: 50S ribosomal protein L11 methyltransferase [Gammaproteobacteria bacterium]PIE36078.1 MAG: 50S ribosomal protein L11 methyltransferase [Gammaproteobacteria bacterium]
MSDSVADQPDDHLAARSDAPWPEVKLVAAESEVDALETWLFEAGALSVTLSDPSTSDDPAVAVLEPSPNEFRLWQRVGLTGLFAQGSVTAGIHEALQSAATNLNLGVPEYRIDMLADTTWERTWLEHFRPMAFGRHLWIIPGEQTAPEPDAINLRLDPGLAFGTGTHPTTALCLDWLDARARDGRGDGDKGGGSPDVRTALAGLRVLDYGCGSGILAMAAAMFGAETVLAVDIDPQAITATRANVVANGLAGRIEARVVSDGALLEDGTELAAGSVDLILANILHQPLMSLVSTFTCLLRPGGELVMSGILTSQVDALTMRYNSGFDILSGREMDGWALVSARRNSLSHDA